VRGNKKWDGGRSIGLNALSQLYALVVGDFKCYVQTPFLKIILKPGRDILNTHNITFKGTLSSSLYLVPSLLCKHQPSFRHKKNKECADTSI